jgi:hypothetical protein
MIRLMVVMAQTFHWSETRIAAYLQAEGEEISPAQVRVQLQEGYQLLEAALPEDIRAIYLGEEITHSQQDSQVKAGSYSGIVPLRQHKQRSNESLLPSLLSQHPHL